jgi:ABC-type antimicrobial peptide transport system permease subunit
MRIVKKIDFEKVKKIDLFLLLKQKINKIKQTKLNSSIAQVNDIYSLNYYLIIECKDISKELGFDKNKKPNEIFFNNEDNNKKFIKHLKVKNSQPFYFKKLGLLNEITSCYLVATTKKEKENISIYNSINTVSCKFDFDNLPSDFEDICNEYETYNINNDISINPYLNDIFNISTLERDKILESILKSVSFVEMPKNIYNTYEFKTNDLEEKHLKNNIENVIENKIKNINDIDFLEKVMESAIENDNFELCAKIRDKIKEIKKL